MEMPQVDREYIAEVKTRLGKKLSERSIMDWARDEGIDPAAILVTAEQELRHAIPTDMGLTTIAYTMFMIGYEVRRAREPAPEFLEARGEMRTEDP
jgi:hypothetical protein